MTLNILACVLYLDKRDKFSVAITGIVLVKEDFAIVSARDISQVPRNHIIEDGKAMFIISDYTQWYCGVREVTVHPEFELHTYNSIALLHLRNSSIIPAICWNKHMSIAPNQLYAMGYTDRNKILEKVLYKMDYVKRDLCEEFYNRVGYKQTLADEQEYVCGSAPTNTAHCEWDTGMVLASNSTGYWTLIGFGIRSPGCAAPARFVSTPRYMPWIESIIDLSETQNDGYYVYK